MRTCLGCIFLDLQYFKYVPERGLVEHTQEVLIFLSASIFLFLAFKKNNSALWLVGGFLGCMFIRELDSVFDKIFHSPSKSFFLIIHYIFVFVNKNPKKQIDNNIIPQNTKKDSYKKKENKVIHNKFNDGTNNTFAQLAPQGAISALVKKLL